MKMKKIIQIFLTLSLIVFFLLPQSTAIFDKKPIVRIAIIRQEWDILDKGVSARLHTYLIKNCFRRAEKKYDVKFRVFEFWDDWEHGHVQRGSLRWRNIDVIVAPGGVGGWYTPHQYRWNIRRFVRTGGGFYGICGDSTFGSLGVKNLDLMHHRSICKVLGFETLSPMLKLANVYTDASSIEYIIKNPILSPKFEMMQFLSKLPFSRGSVHCNRLLSSSIQEPYEGKNVRVMLGNAPLIEGSTIRKLTMHPVKTIAFFGRADDPYKKTINHKKAIVSTTFGLGKVILSPIHAEATIGNRRAQDLFVRNVIWLSKNDEILN